MTATNQEHEDKGSPAAGRSAAESHWLVRVGLVVAAVAVALWNWDTAHRYAINEIGDLSELGIAFSEPIIGSAGRLTEEQRFLLEGDTTRAARHERQRAIWEAHPANRIYLGNYITALQAAASASESIPIDHFRAELAEARALEPENARYDYLEAGRLLNLAAAIHSETVGKDEAGKKKTDYKLEVRDRDQLDEAMAILQRGLGKPYWRRHSADMLREQLAVLGPPRRFIHLVQRTAIAAGTLLPDLAQLKSLARVSRLYAELLIDEGKSAEAVPFLEAWGTLARHLTEDSFTLIDLLVAAAVINEAKETIPPIYRRMGREADAQRTEASAAAIAKPVNDWRQQQERARDRDSQTAEQRRNEQVLEERAGILASMLLPALGEWPDAREYEPGRMLEYAVFTELLVAVILGALLLAMGVSYLLALRWRVFRPANEPPPLLLMPDPGKMIRIMVLGVVLPLVLFFVVTRYLPGSGHAYSVRVGMPKLMAEFGLLTMALVILPIGMTLAHLKRRCVALGVNVTRWSARHLLWISASVGALLLIIAWCLPVASGDSVKALAWFGLGFMAFALVVAILLGFAQGLAGQRQYGTYYGAVFRTLVPMLALTIVVLGIIARPALLQAEASYIDRDTLMHDRDRVGFTRLENDLVQELRSAMIRKSG